MIIKFQQGGNALPPFATYNPISITNTNVPQQSSANQNTDTSKKGSNLTDKDLLTMLDNLEGLPSDMQVLTKQLQNFYIDQQYNPIPDTSNIASRYLSTLYQLKHANFNRKQYDNAFNIVSQNGGLNELAITDRGQLLGVNSKGDFKLLSIEDLKKNKNYTPLTNSEVLKYRAYSPELANNADIIKIVQNGISMKSVTDLIKTCINNLGSEESSQEGYLGTSSRQLISGLKDFINASQKASGENYNPTTDNLYHYKYLTKDQTIKAKEAINYIYNMLPENAKTLLKTKSQDGSDKGAITIIEHLINSQISGITNFELDLETPHTNKSNSKSNSNNSANTFDMDPVSMLQAGYGEKQTITIQTGAGTNAGIQVPTVRMPIVNKDGNSVGANSTLTDITESAFSGYLDFENATMGGINIPVSGFNNVSVNGTALYTGYLPIDEAEYNKTGNIRPDIDMLSRYQTVQRKIAELHITDKNQINALYREANLPLLYDGNGNVMQNYRKFGMINARALSTAFAEEAGFSDYLSEVTDENEIQNTINILQKGRNDKDRIDFDEKSWWDRTIGNIYGSKYDKIYKGTIFIPVNNDYFTSTAGFGNYPNTSEAEIIESKQLALDAQKKAQSTYVNPGTL